MEPRRRYTDYVKITPGGDDTNIAIEFIMEFSKTKKKTPEERTEILRSD